MRRAVQAVLNLGRLPSESATSKSAVFVWEARLTELPLPLTGNEARALAHVLGEDYCFGLAWTLIHAIETAGVDVVDEEPDRDSEPARWSLWRRARNADQPA